MSSQLNDFTYSRFLTSDALTYTEQTIPLFREAFAGNEFLTAIVDSAAGSRQSLIEQSNRDQASAFTPVARKWDIARTNSIGALHDHFGSIIKRAEALPEQAKIAEVLSAILSLKCPEFNRSNDAEQTVDIDKLKTEMEKEENKKLAEQIGATAHYSELFTYNENYKAAVNGRAEEVDTESPKVRNLRNGMLRAVALMHSNLGELVKQKPGTYDEIIKKINSFNTEITARVRARLTREANKGPTDAVIVEKETVSVK